jgi:molybdenum cofactor biosynthesis protein B
MSTSLNLAVLTVSDTRSPATDTSGDLLAQLASDAGHTMVTRSIVKDDIYQIRSICSQWIAEPGIGVILITGGTGFSGRDSTTEAVTPLFDKEIIGFGEMFRHISLQQNCSSTIQSRDTGGLANQTLLFCLPGSNNACRTAWEGILLEQLDSATKPCNFVNLLIGTYQS